MRLREMATKNAMESKVTADAAIFARGQLRNLAIANLFFHSLNVEVRTV